MERLVLVACGAQKRQRQAPAADLYTGAYFRSCIGWAHSYTSTEAIFIISALHGLVPHDEPLDPYDCTLDDPRAVSAMALRIQAAHLGLIESPAIVVGGSRYVDLIRSVWRAEYCAPFAGWRSMGQQRHAMHVNYGRLPEGLSWEW